MADWLLPYNFPGTKTLTVSRIKIRNVSFITMRRTAAVPVHGHRAEFECLKSHGGIVDPGWITTPQSIPEFVHAQKSQSTIRAQTLRVCCTVVPVEYSQARRDGRVPGLKKSA